MIIDMTYVDKVNYLEMKEDLDNLEIDDKNKVIMYLINDKIIKFKK